MLFVHKQPEDIQPNRISAVYKNSFGNSEGNKILKNCYERIFFEHKKMFLFILDSR